MNTISRRVRGSRGPTISGRALNLLKRLRHNFGAPAGGASSASGATLLRLEVQDWRQSSPGCALSEPSAPSRG